MAATIHFTAALLAALLTPNLTLAFIAPAKNIEKITLHKLRVATESSPTLSSESWLDVLKFDGQQPNFDVLEKAIQYTSEPGYKSFTLKDIPTEYYSQDYVFRGPVVGPINRKDLVATNTWFGLEEAFPDLDRQPFGFTVDPENPFRVLFFERWKATHTGDMKLQGLPVGPASGKKSISPVMPFSITFNPDGEIIYECLTTAVDRFEGNTKGKVAVFGLLETAGVSLDNNVGNPVLVVQQKLNRFLNGIGQVYSKKEDVPRWWKSRAVAAEKNDI
jgi:hypothetical protein